MMAPAYGDCLTLVVPPHGDDCVWLCRWHGISDVDADSLHLVCVQGPTWIQVWHFHKYKSSPAMYSTNSSMLSDLSSRFGRTPLLNLEFSDWEDVYC